MHYFAIFKSICIISPEIFGQEFWKQEHFFDLCLWHPTSLWSLHPQTMHFVAIDDLKDIPPYELS